MKRRNLTVLIMLAAGLLVGCQSEKKEPVSVQSTQTEASEVENTQSSEVADDREVIDMNFTSDNFPILDGSTSLKPLGVALRSLLTGEDRAESQDALAFHRTDDAYYYLEDRSSDILIAAEPFSGVWDQYKADNFEVDMEPIAMEGLVFVVNENNPVDSLTVEQIQKIYTGEITNWSQVGGEDLDIVPFQRTESSGSQVMMRKCVMDGLEMSEAPKELTPSEMDGLIEQVKSFDGAASAIGYTVYYYATDMKMADGLKILKVNDIEPTDATIGSGEYPFLNPYYCVIRKDEPKDSDVRKIYDWFVTPDGQKLVELEGYVPYVE